METAVVVDRQPSLMKAILSNQWTVQFLDASEVDTVPDTNTPHWPPTDEWMQNLDDIGFWKVKEKDWGMTSRSRAMASELFKVMLSVLSFFNLVTSV